MFEVGLGCSFDPSHHLHWLFCISLNFNCSSPIISLLIQNNKPIMVDHAYPGLLYLGFVHTNAIGISMQVQVDPLKSSMVTFLNLCPWPYRAYRVWQNYSCSYYFLGFGFLWDIFFEGPQISLLMSSKIILFNLLNDKLGAILLHWKSWGKWKCPKILIPGSRKKLICIHAIICFFQKGNVLHEINEDGHPCQLNSYRYYATCVLYSQIKQTALTESDRLPWQVSG